VLISGAALVAIICTKSLQEVAQTNPNNNESPDQVVSHTGEEVTVRAKPVLILGVSLLMVFANENMVIVYGAWLEKQFNLQVQTLGLYSILEKTRNFYWFDPDRAELSGPAILPEFTHSRLSGSCSHVLPF
jgi:hypothetical protein